MDEAPLRIMMDQGVNYQYEYYIKPGLCLNDKAITKLSLEIQNIAFSCFSTLPGYQCMTGAREDLNDKIILLARDQTGKAVAFQSLAILEIPRVGEVLHIGLLCVEPQARRSGIAHQLLYRGLFTYIFRYKHRSSIWITNVSSIFSVLATLSYHCKQLYPSVRLDTPTKKHRRIAEHFSTHSRKLVCIPDSIEFDKEKFICKEGNRNSVFYNGSKNENATYSRDDIHNEYYKNIINSTDGDAVLQVGHLSAWDSITQCGNFVSKKIKKSIV